MARRFRLIGAAAAVAALAVPGVAQAACPIQPTTQVFAQFGDLEQYFLAPGGSFEGRKSSWTLHNKTALSRGNSPFYANASTDKQSLTVTNGSATSPAFCVDATMPSFRLFARQTEPYSDLRVRLRYNDETGSGQTRDLSTLTDGSQPSWGPSVPMRLATALPIPLGGDLQVQLEFMSGTGAWQVDDVFIDPYRAG